MTITVRRWRRPSSATLDDLELSRSVLLYDPLLERDFEPVAARFRMEDPTVRAVDTVIFRVGSAEAASLLDSDSALRSMLDGVTVGCTFPVWDTTGSSMRLDHLSWSAGRDLPSVADICAAEVAAILEFTGAVFTAPEQAHFLLPSYHHASQFVRLGEALMDPTDVGRLADWVMPSITERTVLLSDTGSILPLALALEIRALRRHHWNITLLSIQEYPVESTEVSDTLDEAARQLGEPHVLFLVSVNSSGGLLQRVLSQAPVNFTAVIVCDTGEQPHPEAHVLCHLPLSRWPTEADGKCEKCKELSGIVIDPRTYQPHPELQVDTIDLNWTAVSEHREFWAAVQRSDAVALHKDVKIDEDRVRHFAVYLDTVALLDDPAFHNGCIGALGDALSDGAPPDLVLIPQHRCSDKLEQLVQEVARQRGLEPLLVERLVSGRLGKHAESVVKNPCRVLICDDALVEGSTLTNLRTTVLTAGRAHGVDPKVDAFVLVARPCDDDVLTTIKRRYRTEAGVRFGAAIEIFLPAHRNCPWCAERNLWGRWASRMERGSGRARARMDDLNGSPEPLLIDGAGKLEQTLGAAIGDLEQPVAFAALSAAVQKLRLDLRSPRSTSVIRIANARMMLDAYFDPVFLAACLRTLDRKELRWPGLDSAVADFIRLLDPVATPPSYLTELTLAGVTTRIPLQPVSDLVDRMAEGDLKDLLQGVIQVHQQ